MDLFDEKITEIEDIEKKKVLVSNVYDEQNHVVSGLLTKSQCTQKAVYGIGMSVLCVQQTERCRHRTIILSRRSTSRLSRCSALEWAQDAHVVNLLLQYNPTYKVQLTRTGYSNS